MGEGEAERTGAGAEGGAGAAVAAEGAGGELLGLLSEAGALGAGKGDAWRFSVPLVWTGAFAAATGGNAESGA